jgi:hypothetical protein
MRRLWRLPKTSDSRTGAEMGIVIIVIVAQIVLAGLIYILIR